MLVGDTHSTDLVQIGKDCVESTAFRVGRMQEHVTNYWQNKYNAMSRRAANISHSIPRAEHLFRNCSTRADVVYTELGQDLKDNAIDLTHLMGELEDTHVGDQVQLDSAQSALIGRIAGILTGKGQKLPFDYVNTGPGKPDVIQMKYNGPELFGGLRKRFAFQVIQQEKEAVKSLDGIETMIESVESGSDKFQGKISALLSAYAPVVETTLPAIRAVPLEAVRSDISKFQNEARHAIALNPPTVRQRFAALEAFDVLSRLGLADEALKVKLLEKVNNP